MPIYVSVYTCTLCMTMHMCVYNRGLITCLNYSNWQSWACSRFMASKLSFHYTMLSPKQNFKGCSEAINQSINQSISMKFGWHVRHILGRTNRKLPLLSLLSLLAAVPDPLQCQTGIVPEQSVCPNISTLLFLQAHRKFNCQKFWVPFKKLDPLEDKAQINKISQKQGIRRYSAQLSIYSQRESFALTLLYLLISALAPTLFISDTLTPIYSHFLAFNFTSATFTTLTLTRSISNSTVNL